MSTTDQLRSSRQRACMGCSDDGVAASLTRSLWCGPREEFQRYRVTVGPGGLQPAGEGGQGLVYLGHRASGGPSGPVALKMLTHLKSDEYELFAARSDLMRAVDHPNLMRQLETFMGTALLESPPPFDDEYDVPYSVANWVPGHSLAEAVAASSTPDGLRWVVDVARGVDYLHGLKLPGAPQGIAHRDIKPSNVRVTPEGMGVLIDFGTARPESDDDRTRGIGTFHWRAPELLGGSGVPGTVSDVWGIGALAYWVLVGEPPRLEDADDLRERMDESLGVQGLPRAGRITQEIAALQELNPSERPEHLSDWISKMDALLAPSLWSQFRRLTPPWRKKPAPLA